MSASKKINIVFNCELCGKRVLRFKRSDSKFRFCSTSCAVKNAIEISRKVDKSGINNGFWKGGIRYASGYRFLLKHNHPNSNDKGYVQEHRLVMEEILGRYLTDKERIHHINGNKLDNRIENLQLCVNQSEHTKIHMTEGIINFSYWKGKRRSEQTKKKMSESHKKLWKIRKIIV